MVASMTGLIDRARRTSTQGCVYSLFLSMETSGNHNFAQLMIFSEDESNFDEAT